MYSDRTLSEYVIISLKFAVFAAKEIPVMHIQCRQCILWNGYLESSFLNTELTSFHLRWVSGVISKLCVACNIRG